MTQTKSITLGQLLVEKCEGGYRVVRFTSNNSMKPVNEKVYFHPTSAYAALGRIAHAENVAALELDKDPAKAPAKEAEAK